jgi:hypothetical protein
MLFFYVFEQNAVAKVFLEGASLDYLSSCEGEAVDAELWLVLVNYTLVLNSSFIVPQVSLISISFGTLGASPFFYYENMLVGGFFEQGIFKCFKNRAGFQIA